MKSTRWYLSFSIVMAGFALLYGCPKSTEVSSAPEAQPQKVESAPAAPAAQTANAASSARSAGEVGTREASAKSAAGLRPIYFDYDRSTIRDDAKAVLKADAEYLKAHPGTKIRIEGNCDERGTIEYNQALGQRRAASARKYLAELGIPAKRISLISYGKEKPTCTAGTEDCWQKNRRDDVVSD